MISIRYSNAISEVLQYLKGVRQEDIDKIPQKFMTFLEENASKDYECNFDYNQPLKDIELLDETKGIIEMICLNYWCETKEQKDKFLKCLNENEKKHQEELSKKCNIDNIFNKKIEEKHKDNLQLVEDKKENIVKKIFKKIISFIKKTF